MIFVKIHQKTTVSKKTDDLDELIAKADAILAKIRANKASSARVAYARVLSA